MKSLISLMTVSLLSTYAIAQTPPPLTPGLWKVNISVDSGGKKINPMAEMENAMAQMPEAQRKQMMEMMKKSGSQSGVNFGANLTEICLTKEMIKDGALGGDHKQDHCTNTIKEQSAKILKSSFNCKDGTKGDMEWNFINNKEYKGFANITDSKGHKSKMDYQSKFISEKCK